MMKMQMFARFAYILNSQIYNDVNYVTCASLSCLTVILRLLYMGLVCVPSLVVLCSNLLLEVRCTCARAYRIHIFFLTYYAEFGYYFVQRLFQG